MRQGGDLCLDDDTPNPNPALHRPVQQFFSYAEQISLPTRAWIHLSFPAYLDVISVHGCDAEAAALQLVFAQFSREPLDEREYRSTDFVDVNGVWLERQPLHAPRTSAACKDRRIVNPLSAAVQFVCE
jgi:hypothetical protein